MGLTLSLLYYIMLAYHEDDSLWIKRNKIHTT